MRKYILFALALALALTGCGQKEELKQDDYAMQYFFTAKVVEVHEEYLRLTVFDRGNTSIPEGAAVEVSTDVVSADGCPAFAVDECARVLMASNADFDPANRFAALAIYKTDETGKNIAD